MNTKTIGLWIKGLAAAAVGGAANVVTLLLVDPLRFSGDLKATGSAAAIGALIAVAGYLKKSPLPED
jgi:hypothetical protein